MNNPALPQGQDRKARPAPVPAPLNATESAMKNSFRENPR